jgi:hypothetical protein
VPATRSRALQASASCCPALELQAHEHRRRPSHADRCSGPAATTKPRILR